MQTVNIYIDTSIKGSKRRNGFYQYIIMFQTSKGPADKGETVLLEETTENQATLFALEAALKCINRPCKLMLYLECPHVAAVLQNKWYIQWRNQGWMTAKNKPVSDVKKWRSIEYLLNAHDFEVHLKQPHTYRGWMQRTLSKKEEERNV